MKKINSLNQKIVLGSSHLLNNKEFNFDRENFMLINMEYNKAYQNFLLENKYEDKDKKILNKFKEKYLKYRTNWEILPKKNYEENQIQFSSETEINNPLCVDIEVASICDLACPHCFREAIMTPDKIMNESLFRKIIDNVSELDIPSIKLNWRGEPLMHPKIIDFIEYAKKKNILEIIINTNCTNLNLKMSNRILESGLDHIIFSFDGGTENTYNKMRPGRFNNNKFQNIYNNIKNFCELKKKNKKAFPTTKIQMVLTKDTRSEVQNFHGLFDGVVDDVTVIQYNERGGNLEEIDSKISSKIKNFIIENKLSKNTPFMVTVDDRVYISDSRKPCSQLFQRLMVTYDGKVGMCCHDWGAQHCIGYVDTRAFNENIELKKLEQSIINNKKGFELLKNTKQPNNYNNPKKKISSLKEIWTGDELSKIRTLHTKKLVDNVEVCKKCTFKDTYNWREI